MTIDGVWIACWIYWPLLYTTQDYSLQITDTRTSVLSLLQSPLAVSWQHLLLRRILQLPAVRSSWHSRLCRTLVNWQLRYLGPELAAISYQLFSFTSQTDFQLNWQLNSLTHEPATSRHFTELNCWQLITSGTRLTLLITFRHEPHTKCRSHCYSPTIPRLLYAYTLPSDRPDIGVFT
jgi:hypothetical protein